MVDNEFRPAYPESEFASALSAFPQSRGTPGLSPRDKRKVMLQIVNPLPGGHAQISMYHLERHIKRGRAYVDETGRVVFTVNTIDRLITAENILQRRMQNPALDKAASEGLLTKREAKHLPLPMYDRAIVQRSRRKRGE